MRDPFIKLSLNYNARMNGRLFHNRAEFVLLDSVKIFMYCRDLKIEDRSLNFVLFSTYDKLRFMYGQ